MIRLPSDAFFSRINRALIVTIVLINSYVLLTPFIPAITFEVQQLTGNISVPTDFSQLDTSKNLLIVPELGLTEIIHEGSDLSTANKGVWRRPNTSTPAKGSNTVMVGHRFTYDGSSVFYHLDKLSKGDKITSIWKGRIYNYVVDETKVVPATAIEVEAPTQDDRLTLYTCTPLWSAENRLVIIASPQEESQ